MKLKVNLTKDEMEWLHVVTKFGAEVTRYLQNKPNLADRDRLKCACGFGASKDWGKIQFGLFEKIHPDDILEEKDEHRSGNKECNH